jgi:hypothetical protein
MGLLVPHLPTDKGAEARLRSQLEDLVGSWNGPNPGSKLALAIWFSKALRGETQHVLALFAGFPMNDFGTPLKFPLRWRTGEQGPPFAEVNWTSVEHFSRLLTSDRQCLERFFDAPEVLRSDKALLSEPILRAFNVVTEPPGLIKGWYVGADQFEKSKPIRNLLSSYSHSRPNIGLVKTYDPPDAENCRGLLHVEVGQRWVPLSANGLKNYTFYNDWLDGRPGFFLFKVGSLYGLLKFEEKTEPAYSTLVLERLPNDRYPEVYLRAVHPTEEPAA